MECPNCALLNPDTALRCDCGYDFATKSGAAARPPRETWYGQAVGMLIAGAVCALAVINPLVEGHGGFAGLRVVLFSEAVGAASILAALVGMSFMARPTTEKGGSLLLAAAVGAALVAAMSFALGS